MTGRLATHRSNTAVTVDTRKQYTYMVKGKVFPSVGPEADPGVQAVSPQVT